MTKITNRSIAPAGSISQIAQLHQDGEIDRDQTTQVIEVVAEHAAEAPNTCPRCQRANCPVTRGGNCQLPDMKVVDHLVRQLQTSN